jgi:hypothetical protein
MQAATTHIHGQHGSGCGCPAAQEIWVKKTAVVLPAPLLPHSYGAAEVQSRRRCRYETAPANVCRGTVRKEEEPIDKRNNRVPIANMSDLLIRQLKTQIKFRYGDDTL